MGHHGGGKKYKNRNEGKNPQIELRLKKYINDNVGETIVAREIDLGIEKSIFNDKKLAFLKDWEKLERIFILKIIVNLNREIKPIPQNNILVMKLLQKNKLIGDQKLFDFYEIRKISNKLINSKKIMSQKTLKKFNERLKDLIKSLEKIAIKKINELK